MVREPRSDGPGILDHFMVCGTERRPVFMDDHDQDEFVRCLSEIRDLMVSTE